MGLGTRLLLKARPTTEQLVDRLTAPRPEGLELYLDRQDLAPDDWLDRIATVAELAPRDDFTWIVEAPIRTLGDQFFDLTANDEDHRETVRRVIQTGARLGAVAANIHVVAPTLDPTTLTHAERTRRLAAALPLLEYYATLAINAGMTPLIENVPPVGRMREAAFVFSAIGAAPEDLAALIAACPQVRLTVDVSHAGLYVNWLRSRPADIAPEHRRVAEFLQERDEQISLAEYVGEVAESTTTVHVSNAADLLGEGLWYRAGQFDLDTVLAPLVGSVPFFVTETLEPNQDRATGMRDAQEWLRSLISRVTRRS